MTVRRLIFWLHLSVGLLVGLVIAFLAVTGCILAFQQQIVAWAERDARIAPAAPSPRAPVSALLHNAAVFAHKTPTSVTLYADLRRPAEVMFGADSVVLLNSCNGQVIGNGAGKLRGFFQSVRDLHRWVAFNGVRHESLRKVKNACVLAFVFLILNGLVLWVPRKLTWRHARPAVFFRGDLRGRARDWNWHNVFGFWMSVPLLVIALSGVIMAYSWANAVLYRVAGCPPPAEREEAPKRPKPLAPDQFGSLDKAAAKALLQQRDWKSISMRLPAARDPNVTFTVDRGDGGQPQDRAQLIVARKDGAVVRWEPFSANSRGRQWRLYARFLHTGEIFGLAGRAIAALAALSAVTLVWTGFSLALRRFAAWRKRAALSRESISAVSGTEAAQV